MFKKLLAFFMSVLMVMSVLSTFSISAFAAEEGATDTTETVK